MKKLSAFQEKVLEAFDRKNKDIDIVVLYMRVYLVGTNVPTVRQMQQRLAPTFAEINKKLKRGRIVVGELKRTYRYSTEG